VVALSFTFSKIPRIHFGQGKLNDLPGILREFGNKALIITGASSLKSSGRWDVLVKALNQNNITHFDFTVTGEPSPDIVDGAVSRLRDKDIDVVASIGGGSVIDAGKAISAMLPHQGSVLDFLEAVGTKLHSGEKVPFVAVPTTSGTGSEATKNAVLSRVGPDGFKRSLRHDNFVSDVALIDPELMLSCPPDITAACGMDAFCQLLESYVSTKSNPMTDALALSGLKLAKDNLVLACGSAAGDVSVRAPMAYASLISGITLANAGLGIVHGLASPIGGYFDIPHGVVCGTLIGAATRVNIYALKNSNDKSSLKKYADIGALLTGCQTNDIELCCNLLIEKIEDWVEQLKLPYLSKYGIAESHLDQIIQSTGQKENPVELIESEIRKILLARMKEGLE